MRAQLARGGKSAIYSAILKYGISNFSLYILEYCELASVLVIEQKYLDLYKPDYNILRIAGSNKGHKVSDETRARMSKAFKGAVVSEEGRKNIAAGQGTPVMVLDLVTNTSTDYVSISDVARFFKVYTKKIYRCAHEKKLYLDRYQILLVDAKAPSDKVGECSQVALYDIETKRCIYKAENIAKLCVDLKISDSNISLYLNSLQPYLGRFIFSTVPLSGDEYAENLLETKNLLDLVKSVGNNYRLALIKDLTSARDIAKPQHELKKSKQVKITNIDTHEVYFLDSIKLTAKFMRLLDPAFKCTMSSVSECIIEGRMYKKVYKFEEVSPDGSNAPHG